MLWHAFLTIYHRATRGEFAYPGTARDEAGNFERAWAMQSHLVGLALGLSKDAFDRLLAGAYTRALGEIGNLTELFLHSAYLFFRPSSVNRWYTSAASAKSLIAPRGRNGTVCRR